jgi:hypothetical protein
MDIQQLLDMISRVTGMNIGGWEGLKDIFPEDISRGVQEQYNIGQSVMNKNLFESLPKSLISSLNPNYFNPMMQQHTRQNIASNILPYSASGPRTGFGSSYIGNLGRENILGKYKGTQIDNLAQILGLQGDVVKTGLEHVQGWEQTAKTLRG